LQRGYQPCRKKIQNDPSAFSREFTKKFIQCPTRQIRIGQQLFTRKQGQLETVDEYVVAMQNLAQQMDVPPTPEILRHTVLAGLRPALSGTALALSKEIKTMEEFVEMLRAAELMSTANSDNTAVADLAKQINELSEKLDKITVRRVETPPPSRRVTFQDRRSPSPAPPADAVSRRESRWSNNRNNNTNNNSNRSKSRCTACNRFHDVNNCFARGKFCKRCNLKNHFAICCRTRFPGNAGRSPNFNQDYMQGGYPQQPGLTQPQPYHQ